MRDPIDELTSFDPGGDMNPLPPSEIRRRGDRLRRRNQVLVAAGAAAAVVLIATPLAVLGAQRADDAPDPAPSPTETPSVVEATTGPAKPRWVTQIPDGFPIDAGLTSVRSGPGEDADGVSVGTALNICEQGSPFPGEYVDRLAVSEKRLSGRELATYGSGAEARAMIDQIREQASCDGKADGVWTVHVRNADEGGPLAADDFMTLSLTDTTSPKGFVFQFVQFGNAVLAVSDYGDYEFSTVDRGFLEIGFNSDQVVAEMCVFAAGGCTSSSTDPSLSDPGRSDVPAPDPSIPDGLPLAAGWPEPSGESQIIGPDRRNEPYQLTGGCDETHAPDPPFEDRMWASFLQPEDSRGRQLTTYASADEAVAAVAAIVKTFRDCPVGDVREDGFASHNRVRRLDVGGESWAILQKDYMGDNDSQVFGKTTVIVRVGSAVLIIDHGGHGGYPRPGGVAQMLSEAAEPIAALCRYTIAGC